MTKVLYVSWDGEAQSYMESLFLPLFSATQREGLSWHVCQFSWAAPEQLERTRLAAQARGIGYTHFPVIRKPQPLATGAMISLGAKAISRLIQEEQIDVVFARSIIPAAMGMLATWHRRETRFAFDADGFMADERVDFGSWRADGPMYRLFRDIEAQAVRRASGVMVRTTQAKQILIARAGAGVDPDKIVVLPNAKDPEIYAPQLQAQRDAVRQAHGVEAGTPWVVYLGSLGAKYNTPRLVRWFELFYEREPKAKMLVLTGQEAEFRAQLGASHPAHAQLQIKRVAPAEVPALLSAADLGLSFVSGPAHEDAQAPSPFSLRGVSPIKLAEYLLCGTPVISTTGIGDVDQLLNEEVGYVLHSLDDVALARSCDWALAEVMAHREAFALACRERGLAHFDLRQCGQALGQLLKRDGGLGR